MMSKLIEDLKNKLSAALGKEVEGADPETVISIEEAAEATADERAEREKEKIGDDLGEQLAAPMVKQTEFDAYKAKTEAFMIAAMDHIEATQTVLDGLNDEIKSTVQVSMDALLKNVKSKTQVPAAKEFSSNGQEEGKETPEEYEARRKKIAAEREEKRKEKLQNKG